MVLARMVRLDNSYLSHFVPVEAQQFITTEFISHRDSNLRYIVGCGSSQNTLLEMFILLHFQDESLELIQCHGIISLQRHFALAF